MEPQNEYRRLEQLIKASIRSCEADTSADDSEGRLLKFTDTAERALNAIISAVTLPSPQLEQTNVKSIIRILFLECLERDVDRRFALRLRMVQELRPPMN